MLAATAMSVAPDAIPVTDSSRIREIGVSLSADTGRETLRVIFVRPGGIMQPGRGSRHSQSHVVRSLISSVLM
jgi:hypothetical protein